MLGTAAAADLAPEPMYTKAPPLPALYNWTGFYAGVNVGGSWGRQDVSLLTPAGALINSMHPDGVIGGGQIGYNWQYNSPWVFGLEADIQGSGQRSDGTFGLPAIACAVGAIGCFPVPASAIAYQDKLEWFGTVRGRIGYAIGDQGRWLPYITGGLAYGQHNINGSGNLGATAVAFSSTNTSVGWTIGAGMEWAFADRWSAKLEYLYMDLGSAPTIPITATSVITAGRLTDNIARVGVNYHF
jgi:outer membrane immunogenic protein